MKGKALCVKEPYASMIREGTKTIETRTWITKYRGVLYIVASKIPNSKYSGMAIAKVKLVNCRPMIKTDIVKACCEIYPNAKSWELEEIEKIKPFPVKGRLGVFDIKC